MLRTNELIQILSLPRVISLTSHRNPDGDAMGSCLALARLFRNQGHVCHVILPSDFPDIYYFLEGSSDIIIADEEEETANECFSKSEIIFCLDFNSLERIDKLADAVKQSKAQKVLVDHHIDPEPFADFYLTTTEASSTCELIYELICTLGMEEKIDIEIGECLFTGIITDTGSFKYNTNTNVYRVAGKLKELGVDDYRLQNNLYNSLDEKQLRLLGHCLKSRMEVLPDFETAIIALNKYDYANYHIQRGDTEGIVNYLLMMKNINIGVFVRQQPTVIKMSLRSKGDISVQEIARDHFNGGGHKNASGGYYYGSLRMAIEKLKEVLPNYYKNVKHSKLIQ